MKHSLILSLPKLRTKETAFRISSREPCDIHRNFVKATYGAPKLLRLVENLRLLRP